jgi:8-oxo-dGTP diphosphatase
MRDVHVVRGIVRYKNRYLLLKKIKDEAPYNTGRWEVPGGKYKQDEDSLETLKRELEEETGLKMGKDVVLKKKLHSCRGETDEVRSFAEVYLLDSKTQDIRLSDEHSEFAWKTYEEIKDMDLVLFADILLNYIEEIERGIL